MVMVILSLSVAGVRQLRSFGSQPLHLVANYILTIAYEWVLAGLVLWGLHMRKVPLRQLLGERRPGARAWLADIGVALGYWAVALLVLALLGNVLVKISGSHIDPQKIGDVTQKLAPVTPLEMMLFLVLSISAGICEELVFRGYLQQQFARMGHAFGSVSCSQRWCLAARTATKESRESCSSPRMARCLACSRCCGEDCEQE